MSSKQDDEDCDLDCPLCHPPDVVAQAKEIVSMPMELKLQAVRYLIREALIDWTKSIKPKEEE